MRLFPPRQRRRALTTLLAVVLTAAVAAPAAGAAPADAASADGGSPAGTTCRVVEVPVRAGLQSGPVSGTLCTPPGATSVQLLVAGWTYNRHYWETAPEPGGRSYVEAANARGYATLAIDRLGTGASLHPLSVYDTFDNDTAAVLEVVKALRDGSLGTAFPTVVGVGHSYGSVVTAEVAGLDHDAYDAIITTGFTHLLNYANAFGRIIAHDYLAAGDEKFAGLNLDPLYVTSQPGTRGVFQHGPNTHPSLPAIDESTLKDTSSLVKAATVLTYSVPNSNHTLDVPTLVVNGDREPFFCGLQSATCTSEQALLDHERRWYAPGAPVEAYVVPGTGHSVTLERTAPLAVERMLGFADRVAGRGDGVTGTPAGTLPEIPEPPRKTPGPVAALANRALLTAAKPIADEFTELGDEVPGLGDAENPVPATARLLARLANLLGS